MSEPVRRHIDFDGADGVRSGRYGVPLRHSARPQHQRPLQQGHKLRRTLQRSRLFHHRSAHMHIYRQISTLGLYKDCYYNIHVLFLNLRSRRTSGARPCDYSASRNISCREPRRRSSGYSYPPTGTQCSPGHRTKYTSCLKMINKCTQKVRVIRSVCMNVCM